MTLLEVLCVACMQLLSGTDLRLQHALWVTFSSRMRYLLSTLLHFYLRWFWLIIIPVVGGLLFNLLPDRGSHCAPVLDLFSVQLIDSPVRLSVLLLPPDRVEVGTKLR